MPIYGFYVLRSAELAPRLNLSCMTEAEQRRLLQCQARLECRGQYDEKMVQRGEGLGFHLEKWFMHFLSKEIKKYVDVIKAEVKKDFHAENVCELSIEDVCSIFLK